MRHSAVIIGTGNYQSWFSLRDSWTLKAHGRQEALHYVTCDDDFVYGVVESADEDRVYGSLAVQFRRPTFALYQSEKVAQGLEWTDQVSTSHRASLSLWALPQGYSNRRPHMASSVADAGRRLEVLCAPARPVGMSKCSLWRELEVLNVVIFSFCAVRCYLRRTVSLWHRLSLFSFRLSFSGPHSALSAFLPPCLHHPLLSLPPLILFL